jgi:hypothetical protein
MEAWLVATKAVPREARRREATSCTATFVGAQQRVDEAAKADGGKRVFRYVSRDGVGMLNSEAYNVDKLNDDDASDLEDWLNYGLQQPRDVASDQVFYFTEEGKSINKDALRLLKKAARKGFVEETGFVFGNPSWMTDDGQIAASRDQIKSAEPVIKDNDGKVIPLSQRFNLGAPTPQSRARGTELVTRVSGPALAWKKFVSGFRSRGMVSQETYDEYRESDAFKKENAAFVSFIAKDFARLAYPARHVGQR